MNKKLIWAIILIIAIGLVVWVIGRDEKPLPEIEEIDQEAALSESMPVPIEENNLKEMEVIREFDISGENFKFSLNEIRVQQDETVIINFTNTSGFHDWTIDEFDARTKQLQTGQSETVKFVADKTGSFEYYCSVGAHRQMGMKGTLVVE